MLSCARCFACSMPVLLFAANKMRCYLAARITFLSVSENNSTDTPDHKTCPRITYFITSHPLFRLPWRANKICLWPMSLARDVASQHEGDTDKIIRTSTKLKHKPVVSRRVFVEQSVSSCPFFKK